jgi:hypothetical protein
MGETSQRSKNLHLTKQSTMATLPQGQQRKWSTTPNQRTQKISKLINFFDFDFYLVI